MPVELFFVIGENLLPSLLLLTVNAGQIKVF